GRSGCGALLEGRRGGGGATLPFVPGGAAPPLVRFHLLGYNRGRLQNRLASLSISGDDPPRGQRRPLITWLRDEGTAPRRPRQGRRRAAAGRPRDRLSGADPGRAGSVRAAPARHGACGPRSGG